MELTPLQSQRRFVLLLRNIGQVFLNDYPLPTAERKSGCPRTSDRVRLAPGREMGYPVRSTHDGRLRRQYIYVHGRPLPPRILHVAAHPIPEASDLEFEIRPRRGKTTPARGNDRPLGWIEAHETRNDVGPREVICGNNSRSYRPFDFKALLRGHCLSTAGSAGESQYGQSETGNQSNCVHELRRKEEPRRVLSATRRVSNRTGVWLG